MRWGNNKVKRETLRSLITPTESIRKLLKKRADLRVARRRQAWTIVLLVIFILVEFIASLSSGSYVASPNSSDIIYGGFTSKENIGLTYDDRDSSIKDISEKLGISSASITQANEYEKWDSRALETSGPMVIWSKSANYQPSFVANTNRTSPSFMIPGKSANTIFYGATIPKYSKPMLEKSPVLLGQAADNTKFAILKDSGNLITSWQTAQKFDTCYKSPERSLSYLNCANGNDVKTEINAKNTNYRVDAQFMKSRPGDTLQYQLTISNAGSSTIELTPRLDVEDLLEYSKLDYYAGATFQKDTKQLVWDEALIKPQTKIVKDFSIKIMDRIPLARQSSNNSRSYDCQLSSYFGGLYSVSVVCPMPKVIERSLTVRETRLHATTLVWGLFIITSLLLVRNNVLYKKVIEEIDSNRGKVAP